MNPIATLKHAIPKPLRAPARRGLRRACRWFECHPWRTERFKNDFVRNAGEARDRDFLSRLNGRIAFGDTMYDGNGAHYFGVGLSALGCIDAVLASDGPRSVRNILDLPCGYGRVLRFLRLRFPDAKISACDLERAGVKFCASAFAATPIVSLPNLDDLELAERFDLIWCGSLLTHLDVGPIQSLLRFGARHLQAGGVFIVTAAGEGVAERMRRRQSSYGLSWGRIDRLTASFEQGGFAYSDYLDTSQYGVSLASPDWVRKQAANVGGLECISFQERGWDEHQDVFAFRKSE